MAAGSLRGGVHFIRYLEAGNYIGIDINQSLLDAGFAVELKAAELRDKVPRENLVCLVEFEFDLLGRQFDFALAIRCSLTSPSMASDGVSSGSRR